MSFTQAVLHSVYNTKSVLDPSGPKLIYRPQTPSLRYFSDLIILMDLTNDSGQNKVSCENWSQGSGLMAFSFGFKLPRTSFQNPDLGLQFLNQTFFCFRLYKILHKASSYFQNLDFLGKVMNVYCQKIAKKTTKNVWCYSRYVIFPSYRSCLTPFLEHYIQISPKPLRQI